MNRFALILTTLALSGLGLRAASAPEDNAELIDLLKSRILSLESRVMQLEETLAGQSAPLPPEAPKPGTSHADAPETAPAPEPEKKVAEKTAPPEKSRKTYVIGERDTITLIAKKHGIPREELMSANGLREGQQIYIGDSLIIPEPLKGGSIAESDTVKKAKDSKPSSTSGGKVYTVQKGDTLTRIARNHSTTVATIKSSNKLKSDFLSVGQRLNISGSPSTQTTLVNTSTKPETSQPKQDNKGGVGAPANVGELREGETYGLYTVEKGDTLYSLARDFFTSPTEIQRLNSLGKSVTIHPGQDLVVPTSEYYKNHNQLAGS